MAEERSEGPDAKPASYYHPAQISQLLPETQLVGSHGMLLQCVDILRHYIQAQYL